MRYYWIVLLATLIMTSCAQTSTSNSNPSPNTGKMDLSSLEGKHFYLIQKGYSCLSNTPGNLKVLSWADHLEVQNGALWQWGDLCDDEAAHLQPTADQLKIQKGFLFYQGQKYQFFAEQPELCKESPWCVVSK